MFNKFRRYFSVSVTFYVIGNEFDIYNIHCHIHCSHCGCKILTTDILISYHDDYLNTCENNMCKQLSKES